MVIGFVFALNDQLWNLSSNRGSRLQKINGKSRCDPRHSRIVVIEIRLSKKPNNGHLFATIWIRRDN